MLLFTMSNNPTQTDVKSLIIFNPGTRLFEHSESDLLFDFVIVEWPDLTGSFGL